MASTEGLLDRGDGIRLAWRLRAGQAPTVVFLPGFASDMQGTKALALDALCAARNTAILRLDYSGHGTSDGQFEDGTIGRWAEDARQIIETIAPSGPLVLVGSSMGGWIALLLLRHLSARIAAIVGIAAAPDFTERLMWASMAPAERATLERDGLLHVSSPYGPPTAITRGLIEDGRRHLVLDAPIAFDGPMRLLHGQRDEDVPWEDALRIAERVTGDDVQITFVKDGDHRLSRSSDLALLTRTVAALLDERSGTEPSEING